MKKILVLLLLLAPVFVCAQDAKPAANDPAERNKLYHEFHRLIHDEAPYLFLFSPDNLTVIDRAYLGVREFPGGIATRPLWVKPGSAQVRTP